jgi:hypothetical protein
MLGDLEGRPAAHLHLAEIPLRGNKNLCFLVHG